MKKTLFVRTSIGLLITVSLAINVIFIASDVLFDWKVRNLNLLNWTEAPVYTDVAAFESTLYDGCIRNLQTKEYDVPRAKQDIRSIIKSNFEGYGRDHSFSFYGNGYLLWASAEYAIRHQDRNEINKVASLWKSKVDESNALDRKSVV